MDLELEDLKLLCPDGTEAAPSDHLRCHLAAVPGKAVVVRLEDKCRVYKFLERVQVSGLQVALWRHVSSGAGVSTYPLCPND